MNSENFLFSGLCAIILILRLCLPVLLGDSFNYISETLSNLIAAGLIFCVSFVVVVRKLLNKEIIPKSKLDLPIFLALIAASISLIHSASFGESFNSILVFISFIFLFYVLHDSLKSKEVLYVFWSYFLITTFLVACIAVWEYLFASNPISFELRRTLPGFSQGMHLGFYYRRIASLFDWPNILAGYLMLMIPLTWAGSILVKELWQKRALAFLMVLFLLVFFLTFSLMCCVSFFVVSLCILPLILKEFKVSKFNKIPLWLVGMSLFLFFIAILLVRKDFDITARFEYLKQAFLLLRDNPWFGTGADTFFTVSQKYITYVYGFSSYVHNSYLQLWVEDGILGLIAIVSLIGVFVLTSLKALRNEKEFSNRIILIGFIWAIASFLVDNLSNFTMLRTNVALFWWATLASFFAFVRIIETRDPESKSNEGQINPLGRFSLILNLFFLAVLIFFIIRMSLALLSYQEGVDSFAKQDMGEAAFHFYQANHLDPIELNYPMASGSVDLKVYSLSRDVRFLDAAQLDYERAKILAPHLHKIYFVLSNIAAEKKEYLKANQLLKEAIRLSPMSYSNLPSLKAVK